MTRAGATLGNLVGKVEILARGADDLRRATEQALESRRPAHALRLARQLRERLPDVALAVALWADAAEACGLEDELCEALEALARLVPWRSELWLRLGVLAARLRREVAREALGRAAVASGDPLGVRQALLALCDLELEAGEPARALRWLDRLPAIEAGVDVERELRRGECLCDLDQWDRGAEVAAALSPPARVDGRDRVLLARIHARSASLESLALALRHATGAVLLGARGAEEVLLRLVVTIARRRVEGFAMLAERARSIVEPLGLAEREPWRAALLVADGRVDDAMDRLRRGLARGAQETAPLLLSLATERQDAEALSAVADVLPHAVPAGHRSLLDAMHMRKRGEETEALDALSELDGELADWARRLGDELVAAWLPDDERGTPTAWRSLLRALRSAARSLDDSSGLGLADQIARELTQPLQVAICGEFNAGKSTLVNAWLGVEVAPMGALPTTQCVHRVAWAPEPFARIVVQGQPDRVVSHEQLERTLASLEQSGTDVDEVLIYAPLEPLRRVELLDTPGLNAPDHRGRELTLRAVRDAHLVLWLLDASSPMKESERRSMVEASAEGVPIQPIVNKVDRVDPSQARQVMHYVDAAIRSAHIPTYRAAVALSAQRALAARTAPVGESDESGWGELTALLEHEVFDRAGILRESALRRRAGRLVERLLAQSKRRLAAEEQARSDRVAMQEALGRAAGRLEADPRRRARAIAIELRAAIDSFELDLSPLGRHGRRQRADDPEVRAYVVGRALDRIAQPLATAIGRACAREEPLLADALGGLHPLLEPPVRAVVVGAVTVLGEAPLRGAAIVRLVEASLRACAWALSEQTTSSPGAPRGADLAWRLERIASRLAALGPLPTRRGEGAEPTS